MRSIHVYILFFLLTIQQNRVAAQQPAWRSKKPALETRWTSSIKSGQIPLPEYPRPQLVRKEWQNLNGLWDLAVGDAESDYRERIMVPFAVESALSGIMEHHDHLWYRRSFDIPKKWKKKRIILNFGAVDWKSNVFINGHSVGVHKGGYDEFSYDITPFLVAGSRQEIKVKVSDATDKAGEPRGKQTTAPAGIMYTPTTGIWQSVWIEPVEDISISGLVITPDIDGRSVRIKVNSKGPLSTAKILITENGRFVNSADGAVNKDLSIPINKPLLWSPERPTLYSLKVSIKRNNKVYDTVNSYFGMRKISVSEDNGFKKIFLNNRFVYEMGLLDQGFWPDGIYTAPTDEALRSDIEQAKAMGFNLIRKHIKVEPQRWYYWADKLGILVWQDMPSVNSYMPREATPPHIDSVQFKHELRRMIGDHYNSPAIIMWVLFNESQGQHDTKALVDLIRSTDRTRLINEASGDKHFGYGDVIDSHSYPPPNPPQSKTQAMVIGEFGGIGYRYPGHTWNNKAEGYTNAASVKDLGFLYKEYVRMLRSFKEKKGLSASIYTQTTDVETETNGLLSYDRLPKIDSKLIKSINDFNFPDPIDSAIIPLSASDTGIYWRYTFTPPAQDWNTQGFDDGLWSSGPGGFGTGHREVRTAWTTKDIWLRKKFSVEGLSDDQISELILKIKFDREVEIYINGILAFQDRGSWNGYQARTIREEAFKMIRKNSDNVIAVHARKRERQFLDAGLFIRSRN